MTLSGLVEDDQIYPRNEINKLLDSKGCFAVACLIFLQFIGENNAIKLAGLCEPGRCVVFVCFVGLNLCVGR